MKKNLMYLVILLFTANLVSAQTLNLTANGQDPKSPNPVLFTGPGWVNWQLNGAVQPGIVPINGYDANRMAEINQWGAAYNQRITAKNMCASNDANHFFTAGTLTEADVPAALAKLSSTLQVVEVDFQGNSIRQMVLPYNTATKTYDYDYLVTQNVGIRKYLASIQNGDTLLMGDPKCGQASDTATMYMVENGFAHFVQATNNNTNQNNNNNSGNGNLSVQDIIAIINATKQPIIVNAGNNNGNVTLPSNGLSNNSTGTQNSPFTQAQGWTPVATYTLGNTTTTTPATLTTNTTTTANTAACQSCATSAAIPAADLALIERQNQQRNALLAENNSLTAQGNKYAKRTADGTTTTAVFTALNPWISYGIQKLDQHVFHDSPSQGNNVFNAYTTNNTGTVATTEGSSDFNNGCPVGTTWNGVICQ